MTLSRAIVAKVSALVCGCPPTEFAKCAEEKLPYRLSNGACFFVIGRGDKEFPLDLLTNLNYAPYLALVLPYDAVTVRILPVLWLIEIARRSNNGESNCHIQIIGDIGKGAFTGEIRYGFARFPSTIDLLEEIVKQVRQEKVRHLKKMQEKYYWMDERGGILRLCHAYITGALKNKLRNSPNATNTLRKANEPFLGTTP